MIKSGFYIVLIASLLTACNLFVDTGKPVAKVANKILTVEELSRNVPDYLDATDSALWADDYIKKWVQRELLLLKAEENLKGNEKNVSEELEEYRNSLIVFRYKNELIRQKLDTIVKNTDIQKYYNEHRESFILNRNIVKAIFIKIPRQVSSPEDLKQLCSSNDPEKLAKLNEYCISYAKAYDRFNDQWIAADQVMKYTPVAIPDQQHFWEKNRFIETTDIEFYYLVCIRDFRLEGQSSPIEFVQSDIQNIILSKQKLDFLKQIEKDIYKEGLDNNKVKLFKTKK
jgi:hypothetical protein